MELKIEGNQIEARFSVEDLPTICRMIRARNPRQRNRTRGPFRVRCCELIGTEPENRQKISAIRLHRTIFGSDLRDGKAWIEGDGFTYMQQGQFDALLPQFESYGYTLERE